MWRRLVAVVVSFLVLTASLTKAELSSDVTEFFKVLDNHKTVPPGAETGTPDVINFHIRMTSLGPISENTMDFTTTLFIVEGWKDPRLTQSWPASVKGNLIVDGADADHIWRPDTFFLNLKAGTMHLATTPNRYMNVTPAGDVFWAERMTVTLHCHMDLWRYPMDSQECAIDISSVSHQKPGLVYNWLADPEQAFIVMPSAHVNEFTLMDKNTSQCSFVSELSGDFPCLRASIYLKRNIASFIITTYIPSTIVVVLSWMNFWIDTDLVPARISLCTTMTLTTVTTTAARAAFSLTRALDVWMLVCLVFVGSSFAEVAFVHVILQKEKIYNQLLKAQQEMEAAQQANAVEVPPPPPSGTPTSAKPPPPETCLVPLASPANLQNMHRDTMLGRHQPHGGDGLSTAAQMDGSSSAAATHTLAGETVDDEVMSKYLAWKKKHGRFTQHIPKHIYWTNWWSKVQKSTALRLDVTCRVLFPFLFCIWVVVYCLVYELWPETVSTSNGAYDV